MPWHLGAKRFWEDEVFSGVIVAALSHNFWRQIEAAELNMSAYYLPLRCCIHFGK